MMAMSTSPFSVPLGLLIVIEPAWPFRFAEAALRKVMAASALLASTPRRQARASSAQQSVVQARDTRITALVTARLMPNPGGRVKACFYDLRPVPRHSWWTTTWHPCPGARSETGRDRVSPGCARGRPARCSTVPPRRARPPVVAERTRVRRPPVDRRHRGPPRRGAAAARRGRAAATRSPPPRSAARARSRHFHGEVDASLLQAVGEEAPGAGDVLEERVGPHPEPLGHARVRFGAGALEACVEGLGRPGRQTLAALLDGPARHRVPPAVRR